MPVLPDRSGSAAGSLRVGAARSRWEVLAAFVAEVDGVVVVEVVVVLVAGCCAQPTSSRPPSMLTRVKRDRAGIMALLDVMTTPTGQGGQRVMDRVTGRH
jgi:hypothetical protein